MIKIVYFDEMSASDFVDITIGGKGASSTEAVRDRSRKINAKAHAGLMAKFSWFPFFRAKADSVFEGELASIGSTLIKTTVSNTILTDYLEKQKDDKRLTLFTDYTLSAYPNSFAFLKMYTPYMIIAKEDHGDIELSRIDEAFEKGKGYYELIATKKEADKCILRFNIKAFRNNYGLSDLLKMNLVFHTVEVGLYQEDKLDIKSEFSFEKKDITAHELTSRPVLNTEPLLKVYDVILAGVE